MYKRQPFGDQSGVTFADRIDNDGNGEADSPTITQEMVDAAALSQWNIWPELGDEFQDSLVHIIGLDATDIGRGFADGIDNNANPDEPYLLEYPIGLGAEVNSPLVTSDMISSASSDVWGRYKVPGTEIILYGLDDSDIGKPYRDGIDNDGDGAIDEGIDEGIDEMIDESRDDFLDNDGDWPWMMMSVSMVISLVELMPVSVTKSHPPDLERAFPVNQTLIRQTFLNLIRWD